MKQITPGLSAQGVVCRLPASDDASPYATDRLPVQLLTARLPIPITLAEPVVFAHGDRGVLAWRVVLSEELRDLHAAVHAAVPAGDDASHTAPGSWTPHITLARRLRLESLNDALGLIGTASEGTGVSLRRWDSASATVTAL